MNTKSAIHVLNCYLSRFLTDEVTAYLGVKNKISVLGYINIEWLDFNNRFYISHIPNTIILSQSTVIFKAWKNENGDYNRMTGPAKVSLSNGNTIKEWYHNGEYFRANGGPDYTIYDRYGRVAMELWRRKKYIRLCDNSFAPVRMIYKYDNTITQIEHYANGKRCYECVESKDRIKDIWETYDSL